jgi:PKD repeat protein
MPGIYKSIVQVLLFSFFLSSCFKNSFAQTSVPAGNVSGTWSKSKSPYVINGNITIASNQKLMIEPGVKVLFVGQYMLSVNGTLLARGSATDSIIFDQFDDKSSWHRIRIENVDTDSDSTIFEYCRIAHTSNVGAPTNGGNGVLVKNFDKVRVSHSLIRNNKGGVGAGLYAMNANIKINDNVIRNNSATQGGAGIYIAEGSPLIKGNRIEKNYSGSSAGGIWLSASKSRVEDNIISYNSCYWSGAGVVIANTSTCTLLRNFISYNESGHDDGGGMLISGSSPKIINNTIAFNKGETGEGVYITGNSNPDFINTIIYYNRDYYQGVNLNDEIYIETSSALPGFYNCNIQGGINGIGMYAGIFKGIAKNNIDSPPLFRDAVVNDLSISWEQYPVAVNLKSPCIDAGTLDSPHDPDGSTADIGARYFHQTLGNFPPRVDFVADTLLGYNVLAVTFSDLSERGNGKITEWQWAFGDGTTSAERNPVHEYKTEGRFDVTLTIKDEKGFMKKITREEYIRLILGVYVKGNVTGTFDAPRYIVGGDLLVESAKTLEIKPGVELMFVGPYKLEVQGALKAKGTTIKPIVFTTHDTTGMDLAHATTGYSQKPVGWAGIYVYASGVQDSTVIDHCKVNFVENNGEGAIYAFSNNGAAGMRISNSEISYNSTQGISVFATKLIIRNNYIHHNYARAYQKGAGIYFYAGSPMIINNIITNNETADDGGGLCVDWDSRPYLIGNVITHNKASRAGGICDYSGYMELMNNTISFNTSTGSQGGGYFILYAGDVKFTNNIITNNTPAQIEVADGTTRVGFRNCILEGGSAGIKGNTNSIFLYENVLTIDPKLIPGKSGYGRLLPGSPAVNGGTTTGITSALPSFDVVGNMRIANSQIDIGAYEYIPDPLVSVINPISDVNKEEDFKTFAISLESVFGYQYGSQFLSYSVEAPPATPLLSLAVLNNNLYFTRLPDKFGDQTIKVIASSGVNQITTSFVVHIAPVDDAPQFSVEGNMFVAEDFSGPKPYKITIAAIPFGEEDQLRTFAIEPSTVDFITIQLSATGTLSFSAKPNLFGSQQFTLTLTEGQQTHSESFIFAVQPVNDPPIITVGNSPIIIEEGGTKVFPVTVSDVERDAITLTSTAANNSISLSTAMTAANQYAVTVTGLTAASSGVILSANDGKLATSVTVTVAIMVIMGVDEEATLYEPFPNPTIDYVVVKAKENSSVVMYNISGQVVIRDNVGSTDLTLHVAHLIPGLYLLHVNDGINSRVFKILKR